MRPAKTKRLFKSAMLLSLICFGIPGGQTGRAQSYIATDLGAPPSGTDSEAHAVSRSGSVVGIWWTLASAGNAFLSRNGTNMDLGNLGSGKYSIAYAVNTTGQIAGQSATSGGLKAPYHAFLDANGVMVDLGALGDGSWSSANAMNQSGLIAGESITAGTNIHAVLFENGGITDLGALSNGVYSTALGLNDSGVTVGNAAVVVSPGVTNTYGFIYSNTLTTAVGTLGSDTYSTATAINNSGQVVGESATVDGDIHAYMYTGGVMTDLGTLGGGTYSTATAINNFGQVAGYATDSNGVSHAFLYFGTTMINLDQAIAPGSDITNLALAYGINDLGQIVGGGFNTNGHYVAFLVTPVYAPLTLSCSSNLTANAAGPGGATVCYSLSASGGCNAPSVVGNPPSGSTFPIGTTRVNVTASDLCGHTNTCSFTVTVNPPLTPLILASPVALSSGRFQLLVQGIVGQRFAIQTSTDLAHWTTILTNTLVATSTNFADSPAFANNPRFYRALTLP